MYTHSPPSSSKQFAKKAPEKKRAKKMREKKTARPATLNGT